MTVTPAFAKAIKTEDKELRLRPTSLIFHLESASAEQMIHNEHHLYGEIKITCPLSILLRCERNNVVRSNSHVIEAIRLPI